MTQSQIETTPQSIYDLAAAMLFDDPNFVEYDDEDIVPNTSIPVLGLTGNVSSPETFSSGYPGGANSSISQQTSFYGVIPEMASPASVNSINANVQDISNQGSLTTSQSVMPAAETIDNTASKLGLSPSTLTANYDVQSASSSPLTKQQSSSGPATSNSVASDSGAFASAGTTVTSESSSDSSTQVTAQNSNSVSATSVPIASNSGATTASPVHALDFQLLGLYGDASTLGDTGDSGSTATSATLQLPAAASAITSPFTINLVWDASVANAPPGFKQDVIEAAEYLESIITTPTAVTFDVGYGEIAGNALASGDLGESTTYIGTVPYAPLISALESEPTNTFAQSILKDLPSSTAINGDVILTTAQTDALGLTSASAGTPNAYLGFYNSSAFTYSGPVSAGTSDFEGCVLHEMSEGLGRGLYCGAKLDGTNDYSFLDLDHYLSPGVLDLNGLGGYFSADGGNTNSGGYNPLSFGDAGDWAYASMHDDAFDAFATPGVADTFSADDVAVMNALGWTTSLSPATYDITPVPETTQSANLSSSAGLAEMHDLFDFTTPNNNSTDLYSWTSYGSLSSYGFMFSNGTFFNTSPIPGSATGTLYNLNAVLTDNTTGISSAAALQVVVGDATNTAQISAADISGLLNSRETYIYVGAGDNDNINATGITATTIFFAGIGADTFTGGSGSNDYIFSSQENLSTGVTESLQNGTFTMSGNANDAPISSSATGDGDNGQNGQSSPETPTQPVGPLGLSMNDSVTNFSASQDTIDFTGFGVKLAYAGAVTGSSLAADSIGFIQSGGNTEVYVNVSASAENLGQTDFQLSLLGNVNLTASNFVHN